MIQCMVQTASQFMEPETTTKLAKRLEKEIIFMLLHWKKSKMETQESRFLNYYFQLCLCSERGCMSNLRLSMTSESQN